MVIELSEVQFGLKHTREFQIGRARSASSIWNHKYDFRPKLHDTKFSYHFITATLKSRKLNVYLNVRVYTQKSVLRLVSWK